jgi:hypothetical protein
VRGFVLAFLFGIHKSKKHLEFAREIILVSRQKINNKWRVKQMKQNCTKNFFPLTNASGTMFSLSLSLSLSLNF